jgi:signal transduction histidine kinase
MPGNLLITASKAGSYQDAPIGGCAQSLAVPEFGHEWAAEGDGGSQRKDQRWSITGRKRAEAERQRLRHLEADLAHINRMSMLGELAASIAHEVNQPLSGRNEQRQRLPALAGRRFPQRGGSSGKCPPDRPRSEAGGLK